MPLPIVTTPVVNKSLKKPVNTAVRTVKKPGEVAVVVVPRNIVLTPSSTSIQITWT